MKEDGDGRPKVTPIHGLSVLTHRLTWDILTSLDETDAVVNVNVHGPS